MGHWGAVGPTYFMLARLHWDPRADPEDILAEYYSGLGPAAGAMRAYQSWLEGWTLETFTSSRARMLVGSQSNSSGWFPNVRLLFTAAVLDHAASMIQAVETACESTHCRDRVRVLAVAAEHARLTMAAFNSTAAAGDCYGPCLGGSECAFGNASVPCLASRGASPEILAGIIGASTNLTAYRIKIAHMNAVNVYWAEQTERFACSYFPGRDYNGASVTADAANIPAPWAASSLLPSVGWTFTLDAKDEGMEKGWWLPNSTASWNSTASLTSKGWCCGRVPAVTSHHGEYTGVGWYRVTFAGHSGTGADRWAAAFAAVNGSLRVWLNGVAAVEQTRTLWRFAEAPLATNNTLVVRVDAKHRAGGGLTGRVFIARDPATDEQVALHTDDNTVPEWRAFFPSVGDVEQPRGLIRAVPSEATLPPLPLAPAAGRAWDGYIAAFVLQRPSGKPFVELFVRIKAGLPHTTVIARVESDDLRTYTTPVVVANLTIPARLCATEAAVCKVDVTTMARSPTGRYLLPASMPAEYHALFSEDGLRFTPPRRVFTDHDSAQALWSDGRWLVLQITEEPYAKPYPDNDCFPHEQKLNDSWTTAGNCSRRVLAVRTSTDGAAWEPAADWLGKQPGARLLGPSTEAGDPDDLEFYMISAFPLGDALRPRRW